MIVPVLVLQPLQIPLTQILDPVQTCAILLQSALDSDLGQASLISPQDPGTQIVVGYVNGDVFG
jgi:hypothetical protein